MNKYNFKLENGETIHFSTDMPEEEVESIPQLQNQHEFVKYFSSKRDYYLEIFWIEKQSLANETTTRKVYVVWGTDMRGNFSEGKAFEDPEDAKAHEKVLKSVNHYFLDDAVMQELEYVPRVKPEEERKS